jgi:hypothetical protein
LEGKWNTRQEYIINLLIKNMTKKAGRPKIQHSEAILTKCMRIPSSKVKVFYQLAKIARKQCEVKQDKTN